MSKKSNQKPGVPNAEKTEAVGGTIETTAQAPEEEASALEQVDSGATESEAAPASESAEQLPETGDADAEAAPTVTPSAADEADVSEAPAPAATPVEARPTDLAARLTKAVSGMLATGAPDVVHALHKAEMAVGDLKNALPAAVAAADEPLKADLQTLLALL